MSVLMKGMVVVIMLAVATAALACEQPTPQAAPSAASASAEDGVTPAKPHAGETLENTSKDPMVWIAERVPGFGGVFLDSSQNIVYIYLQDDSMQEVAKAVLTDAFGPDLLEEREVRVLEGKYSMVHLDAWYKPLMGTQHRIPGITWTDLNEKTNRIEIGMRPLRGARAKMEAAIAASGVPREAVVINVGCVSSYLRSSGRAISADEAFMSAIDYSLEAVSRVPYGETVRMKLTLRNVGNERVQFFTGGRPPHDFVVTTVDGEEVWYWKCRQIGLQRLAIKSLEPGEELEFVGEWQQVDTWGEPVPAGTYLVRGVLNLEPHERLETAPHKLHVLR